MWVRIPARGHEGRGVGLKPYRCGDGSDERCWHAATGGNIALTTALALPALMAVLGVAADYAQFASKRSELQAAADKAALSAAKELSLATSTTTTISSAAKTFAAAVTESDIKTGVDIDSGARTVTVEIREEWTPFFAHFLGADITPIITSATAQLVGEGKVCVLALGPFSEALELDNKAQITANGCGVYANSVDPEAISLKNKSKIKAELTCSAGGVANKGTITPAAMTDCPPLEDPLSGRATPSAGGCQYHDVSINTGTVTLSPGVYCDGLNISGSARVTFKEGTYILRKGALSFGGNAVVDGTHVGFYFDGKDAKMDFQGSSTINLSGPKDGDMAGLLFFASHDNTEEHRISSNNTQELTGTIYLPSGKLRVDPGAKVGESSAYTAIVAQEIEIDQGPELVLNSDYGATDVPAPDGIRSAAQVVLSR